MNRAGTCPNCGATLSPEGPGGLCPECLSLRTSHLGAAPTPSSDQCPTLRDGKPLAAGRVSAGSSPLKTIQYFGDYELLEEIARGGMGVVYKARQVSLNRIVAVKRILSGQLAGENDVKRFRLEAEAAANLQHPNIVAIHEVGEHEGHHYFSMDYVDGKNLFQIARDGQLPAARAARYVKTIADAVHYAHQRGTFHRDLKPQNVLVDSSDQLRITDFGLAKREGSDSGLTQTGAVLGSPAYMPPEQALGHHDLFGPSSEVYGIGAILYELITGRAPFQGDTPLAVLAKVISEQPLRPSKLNPAAHVDLETICLKCLEKRSEKRYASARALSEELGRFLNHEPILARPASFMRKSWTWTAKHPWVVTGLASVIILGLIGFAYRQGQEVELLTWEKAHPGEKHSFTAAHFFPIRFVVFLFLEFFFIQGVPLARFFNSRHKGTFTYLSIFSFGALGITQFGLAVYLVILAMAAGVWDRAYGTEAFVATLITALTNAWFGSALTWLVIRESLIPTTPRVKLSELPWFGLFPTRREMETIRRKSPPAPVIDRKKKAVAVIVCEIILLIFLEVTIHKPGWEGWISYYGIVTTILTLLVAEACVKNLLQATVGLPFLTLVLICAILPGFSPNLPSALPMPVVQGVFAGLIFGALALKMGRLKQPDSNSVAVILARPAVRKGITIGLLSIPVLVGILLTSERFSAMHSLRRWNAKMASKGEPPDVSKLWPRPSGNEAGFSNRFSQAMAKLPTNGIPVTSISGMVLFAPGKARILWKESMLALSPTSPSTNTWAALDRKMLAASTALEELRELMKNPSPSAGSGPPRGPDTPTPSFVRNRVSAQWLNAAILNELHNGNLDMALKDLISLAGVARLYQDDLTLVTQMIRIAIVGLATETIWESLQSPGWSEEQLAALQSAWEDVHIIEKMPGSYQAERATQLMSFEVFRDSSYQEWAGRFGPIFARFGKKLDAGSPFRRFIFHPVWSFAWSYDEELDYLRYTYAELDIISRGFNQKSWLEIRNHLKDLEEHYQPPVFRQRFYYHLPFVNDIINFDSKDSRSFYNYLARNLLEDDHPGYVSYSKAWETTMRNLTKREMFLAATAIKRYELRHGKPPPTLSALVPSLLTVAPVDLMDGQPLRYRPNVDGTYALYSVGLDCKDDGGDPNPTEGGKKVNDIWDGRDAVWPTSR